MDNRDTKGKFIKGVSGNPNGRPKGGTSTAQAFRDHPKTEGIMEKILEIAGTLGTDNEHKDAMSCAKLVADKNVPTLKAQELNIEGDITPGFVVLPEEKPSKKEE